MKPEGKIKNSNVDDWLGDGSGIIGDCIEVDLEGETEGREIETL